MSNPVPAKIDVDKKQGIRLTWSDGTVTSYSLEKLRTNCPCATCKEERAQKQTKKQPLLRVLPGNYAGDLVIASAELVGNYALKLSWTDGHDTGIYSFTYLRELAGE
jgi:DUF971 family protein